MTLKLRQYGTLDLADKNTTELSNLGCPTCSEWHRNNTGQILRLETQESGLHWCSLCGTLWEVDKVDKATAEKKPPMTIRKGSLFIRTTDNELIGEVTGRDGDKILYTNTYNCKLQTSIYSLKANVLEGYWSIGGKDTGKVLFQSRR